MIWGMKNDIQDEMSFTGCYKVLLSAEESKDSLPCLILLYWLHSPHRPRWHHTTIESKWTGSVIEPAAEPNWPKHPSNGAAA